MSDSSVCKISTIKFSFTPQEDDILIEEIAQHPAIYDLKHKLFKDVRAKDNIWKQIAQNVGRSGKIQTN
jgi:predicted SprT family Zn-dependent metalloprotease